MIGPAPTFGPLAGLRVLDLTVALAGAHSTMLLADLGAEIIKVESLQHYPASTKGPRHPATGPDPVLRSANRDYPEFEPGDDPWNRISWFNAQARNKLDMTVDLTRERGRELFLRLVEISDGIVENNAAGTLEKLRLAPEELLERNPRLVVVRMPPLGLSGPDCGATGFGWHFEELAGMLSVQGYPDGLTVGSIHMDAATGPGGASAFLMGLMQRRRTGAGSVVELAQIENLLHHMGDQVMDAAFNDRVPERWGNRDPNYAPQGVYRCAGEDQWIALTVRSDAEWLSLRREMGGPVALSSSDLGSVSGRRARHDVIDAAIADWTLPQAKEEVFRRLQAAGVPAGPVLDESDAFADPQLQSRGFFHLLTHPSAGTYFVPGSNFSLSATPPVMWRAAPVLGQDNEYVYRELLGVTEEEYAVLVAEGHVGDRYL
ncbi:MAG TPA: CoA transferase [Acidimicrobiales bacterium]|nr:CoA transferase [Acidimicrobiales bacterium]